MAFIETTPASAATEDIAAMYTRQQESYGFVPNYAKVFCYRPALMELWAALQRGVKRSVPKRMFELITVAAAMELRSTNCSLAHATTLRDYYSDAEILAIVSGEGVERGIISDAEQAMIQFARKVARDAAAITREDVNELRRYGFCDARIFDITSTVAARAFFTKIVDGLGTLGDHDFSQLDQALRSRLTTGRAIEVGEKEHVVSGHQPAPDQPLAQKRRRTAD